MKMYYSHYLFVFCTLGNFNILPHALLFFLIGEDGRYFILYTKIFIIVYSAINFQSSRQGVSERGQKEKETVYC